MTPVGFQGADRAARGSDLKGSSSQVSRACHALNEQRAQVRTPPGSVTSEVGYLSKTVEDAVGRRLGYGYKVKGLKKERLGAD